MGYLSRRAEPFEVTVERCRLGSPDDVEFVECPTMGEGSPSFAIDQSSGAGGSGSQAGLGSVSNSSGGPREANTGGRSG